VNAQPVLDAASAHVLGAEWLTKAIAPASPYGARSFADLHPFCAGEEAQAQARSRRIVAVARALDDDRLGALQTEFDGVPDASGAIARASMGDVLDDVNLLELLRFCKTVERVGQLFSQLHAGFGIDASAAGIVGRALAPGYREPAGFYLTDGFDGDLAAARERLGREQAELDAARGREVEGAARELERDEIASDEFIVMRTDLRGTLPPGIRVVREAPTYLLCAVEYGSASLAALARRDAAADAVAAAEERVRGGLSSVVREHAASLDAGARMLGELDVIFSAARFTRRHACVAADVVAQPMLAFEQARFLPLEAELAAAGRRFTPLDLELNDPAVLTGPNMGGKSVALQTCGFMALCAAFGLPVPAKRARVALFDQIAWLGMGRDAEIGGLLSSFAREVVELREILARAAPRLLILVDEFARTTTPHEGRALTVALLARLRERGACGMLATHLAGIPGAAGVRHFSVRGVREVPALPAAQEAAEALAALAESMDYTIAEVCGDDLPHGDAIALTSLLGMDREFVETAYRALVE